MKINFRVTPLSKRKGVAIWIMRSFIFFFSTVAFSFTTGNLLSQNIKITVDSDKIVTVEEAFDLIGKQTEYSFVYTPDLFTGLPRVYLKKGTIPVNKLLKKSLSKGNFDIVVNKNKTIYIKKKPIKELVTVQQKAINGKITDENGQPLPGASIIEKGTDNGVVTDSEGKYSINVADNAILVVSYVGYITQENIVGDRTEINISLQSDTAELEEVVVKGYRESLGKAIDIKKQSTSSVDAIVAEDIAKFPQSNLSEAIQRISGVQIRRDYAGGVGNEISVRGLPPEYTQVTINNQAASNSSEATRTYNFNTLPAELFGTVEVFKSPTAKLDEGGVGGIVNLETRKALEIKDEIFVLSAEGLYNTQVDKITPKSSLVFGKNWNNKFGIIAGVTYNRFLNASQGYDVVRYREQSFDTDGDDTDDILDVRVPLPRYVHQEQDVDRFALNFGTQYRPSDNFTLTFDALYTKNKQITTRYTPIFFIQGADAINVKNDGKLLLSATFQDVRVVLENQQQLNDTDVFQTNLKGNWYLNNDWQIEANFSYGSNKRFIDRPRYYAQDRNSVSYSVEDDKKWFDLKTPTDLTDPSQFEVTEARARNLHLNDKIFSGQFDVTKRMDVLQLDFGAKLRSRNKKRTFFDAKIKGLSDPFEPISRLFTGFLDNEDKAATGPKKFLVPDWDKANALYGPQIDLTNAEKKNAFYDITEDIAASYLMGTFDWPKFKLNAGARLVNTSLTAKGLELDETTGKFSDREVKSSYTDFLPSVNLNYEIGKELYVRGAFSRVMTRPNLSDLTSYREVDDVNLTISEKNPNLKPFRASQYEVSLEWYPKTESLISAAFFVKNIESFITDEIKQVQLNGQTYTSKRPVNGNNASITGVELNYQQPFTFLPSPFDGLGIVSNYTLSDSNFKETVDLETGETESYELPNNSKHSYNLIGYYEKYNFSFRIAHNYRSEFLRSKPVPADGLKYRNDYQQTDISAGYDFSDHFSITLNILNAFNSKRFEYIFDQRFQDNISVSGTTWQFGARYSF